MTTATPPATAALRAEHDDLAAKLEIRRSVDHLRAGAYQAFAGIIAVGLTGKLAWDRWGPPSPGEGPKVFTGPPLFFWAALLLTLGLAFLAARSFVRARRFARDEDALFARYRELRDQLGIDP